MLTAWRDKGEGFVEKHEAACTALLVSIAVILLLIAYFGSPRHKALAMVYIVL